MDTARTFLVVIDATAESRVALRYAVLRAAHVGARVTLLHVVAPQEFMQWGGVQEAMEAQALAEAEALMQGLAAEAENVGGTRPDVIVKRGDATQTVFDHIAADPSVRALVLAAAAKGAPGPLVSYFSGERAGSLPCLVMIVPGGLAGDRIEELS